MRRLLVLLVVVLALACASSAAAARVYVVSGNGWGHGIGLAQYGAQGYASLGGKSHAWILAHYYSGTRLDSTRVSRVRVLLAQDRTAVYVGSDAPFKLRDGAGRTFSLSKGTRLVKPGLKFKIGGTVRTLANPVRVLPGTSRVELGGDRYRGSLLLCRVAAGSSCAGVGANGTLAVRNDVGLQGYLYGVVPWEMPASWHGEALKAQSVAARSYALATKKPASAFFDLYPDTRSQVYGGIRAEDARTNAAVNATAGKVLFSGTKVAVTYFHSTSGGWTAAIEDAWPGATPQPYLKAVADPYDRISPYHRWVPTAHTTRALATKLGWRVRGSLLNLVVSTTKDGRRVHHVDVIGSAGRTQVSGPDVRTLLGLRSSWFRIGLLGLTPSKRSIAKGANVTIAGRTRGVRSAWLERRRDGGAWSRLVTLKPNTTYRVTLKPPATTTYRLRAVVSGKTFSGPSARVTVTAP